MNFYSKNSKPFSMKSVATAPTTAGLTYKSFTFSAKDVNEPQGRVTAAVNAIGVVDMQNDQIEHGAWNSVINKFHTRQQPWPSVLVGHEWSAGVGVVKDAYEGSDQLYVDCKFNLETAAGRDAFSNAKHGIYKNWSVGFGPGDVEHDEHGVRHIKSVDLWPEVSLVLVGASPGTRTIATKSARPNDAIRAVIADTARRTGLSEHQVAQAVLEHLQGPTGLESLGDPIERMVTAAAERDEEARRSRLQPTHTYLDDLPRPSGNPALDLARSWVARWGSQSVGRDAPVK